MKNNKQLLFTLLMLCVFATLQISAKTIEFVEDGYLLQASPEIIELTEKAAQLFDFNKAYEVASPKKSGMQINPSTKLITSCINPLTKNPIFIINEKWFKTLSPAQQLFLLGYNFLRLENGIQPLSTQVMPYLFLLLSIGLMFLLFWILGKAKPTMKKWARAAVVYAIIALCNVTFLNTIQTKISLYLNIRYDMHIIKAAIEKTQNKEAAISAFEAIDSAVKDDLKNGDQFWAPHATLFENYANELKKEL